MMTRIPTIGMTGRILLATTAFLRFHTSSRSKVKFTIKLSRPPPHSRVVQTLTVTVPGSLKKQMLVKMRSSSSCLLWRLVAGRSRIHCSSCSLAAAPPARHRHVRGVRTITVFTRRRRRVRGLAILRHWEVARFAVSPLFARKPDKGWCEVGVLLCSAGLT